MAVSRKEDRANQLARAKKYGITPKAGGNITKPGEWSNLKDNQFGDPVNYSYPIHDRTRQLAALRYFDHVNQQKRGGYTDAEWAIIGHRIARALGSPYIYDARIRKIYKKRQKALEQAMKELTLGITSFIDTIKEDKEDKEDSKKVNENNFIEESASIHDKLKFVFKDASPPYVLKLNSEK